MFSLLLLFYIRISHLHIWPALLEEGPVEAGDPGAAAVAYQLGREGFLTLTFSDIDLDLS